MIYGNEFEVGTPAITVRIRAESVAGVTVTPADWRTHATGDEQRRIDMLCRFAARCCTGERLALL